MEATSFFAQLRRGKHGPIPRERSPSPVPVVVPPTQNGTIDERPVDHSAGQGSSKDKRDGDGSNKHGSKAKEPPTHSTKSTEDQTITTKSNNVPPTGLMNLPFPPGVDKPGPGVPASIPSAHMTLYDNLLGASEALKKSIKNQKVSITKDLPMPPGLLIYLYCKMHIS